MKTLTFILVILFSQMVYAVDNGPGTASGGIWVNSGPGQQGGPPSPPGPTTFPHP